MAHHGCQSKGRRAGAAGDGISQSLEKLDRQHVLLTPMQCLKISNAKQDLWKLVQPACCPALFTLLTLAWARPRLLFKTSLTGSSTNWAFSSTAKNPNKKKTFLPFSKILVTHPILLEVLQILENATLVARWLLLIHAIIWMIHFRMWFLYFL